MAYGLPCEHGVICTELVDGLQTTKTLCMWYCGSLVSTGSLAEWIVGTLEGRVIIAIRAIL